MKKYTIIYGDYFRHGSHTSELVKYKYIECEPTNLKTEIEKTCDVSAVWFVFEGHSNETLD